MERAHQFENLRSDLMESGSIKIEQRRQQLLSETTEVKTFAKSVKEKLSNAGELRLIQMPKPFSNEWSLLCNTSYNITSKAAKAGLSSLCCTVISETQNDVIACREVLLSRFHSMGLRLHLWFTVNQWLHWNPSGLGRRPFEYWDGIPDCIPKRHEHYTGEKAVKIRKLFNQDLKRLGELGDFLSTCPALCNNPDSPAKDRVVSAEIKKVLDDMFNVRDLTNQW